MTQSRTTLLSGAAQRGQHRSPAVAEADRREALAAGAGAQNDLVAILQEAPLLAGGERDRVVAALRGLQQAAEARLSPGLRSCRCRAGRRAADCSRCKCGARSSARPSSTCGAQLLKREPVRREILRAQPWRQQQHFERRDRARPRAGPSRRASRASGAGSPSGRGGCGMRNGASASGVTTQGLIVVREVLGQERAERLVFPGLDVARRPVVQQAEAGDVLGRLVDRDGPAQRVAGPDPDAELQLVVEPLRHGPKLGSAAPGGLRWPFGRRTGVPEGRTDEARPW